VRTSRRRIGPDGLQPGGPCANTFLQFTENSNSLRELCPHDDCCSYVSEHGQFVPHFTDLHINDQAHCVFLPGGESLVDYVGSTATIAQDWTAIVGAINARAGTAFVAAPVTNPNGYGGADGHGQETVCSAPDVRANLNETTLRNIARQYAMDVVRYGFL
jgi:hypothetical protein